jgi:hypothetical protein
MPELNFPAPSLVVGRDHYMSRVKSWNSLLSLLVTVPDIATTFNGLILASDRVFAFTHPTAPGIMLTTADEVIETFTGNLLTCGAITADSLYSSDYSVQLVPGTVVMGFSDGDAWVEEVTDDGNGVLAGDAVTPATGTIDYVTGDWSITFDTAAPEGTYFDLAVDMAYVFAEGDVQALWLSPAGDIFATFDGVTAPAVDEGILISEPILLSAQPALISKMQFIASEGTDLWLEILV